MCIVSSSYLDPCWLVRSSRRENKRVHTTQEDASTTLGLVGWLVGWFGECPPKQPHTNTHTRFVVVVVVWKKALVPDSSSVRFGSLVLARARYWICVVYSLEEPRSLRLVPLSFLYRYPGISTRAIGSRGSGIRMWMDSTIPALPFDTRRTRVPIGRDSVPTSRYSRTRSSRVHTPPSIKDTAVLYTIMSPHISSFPIGGIASLADALWHSVWIVVPPERLSSVSCMGARESYSIVQTPGPHPRRATTSHRDRTYVAAEDKFGPVFFVCCFLSLYHLTVSSSWEQHQPTNHTITILQQ